MPFLPSYIVCMSKSDNDFYVYVIFRMSGEPCYVGRGRKRRWQGHYWKSSNAHLRNIMECANRKLPIVFVRTGISHQESVDAEIAIIRAIGRAANGGPLVNFTDGGEGVVGYRHTDLAKEKVRAVHKGKKLTLEQIEALRSVNLGRKWTPEQIAKRVAKQKGQKRAAEFGERMRQLNLGRKLTEEQKRKVSLTSLGRKQSPESIAKTRAFHLGRPKSKEHKAALRSVCGTPEERAARSARMKALWAQRKATPGYVPPSFGGRWLMPGR